jgi:hypothetical protein
VSTGDGNGPPDEAAAQADDDYYNPVFEKLMAAQSGLLTGAVAYAIYKVAKREWIQEFRNANGRRPTDAEFRGHSATQTDAVLHGYVARADQMIGQYAQNVVDDMRPRIVEEALRGTFWRSVWPSLVASVIFVGVLAILFFIAAIMGIGLPIQVAVPETG